MKVRSHVLQIPLYRSFSSSIFPWLPLGVTPGISSPFLPVKP